MERKSKLIMIVTHHKSVRVLKKSNRLDLSRETVNLPMI